MPRSSPKFRRVPLYAGLAVLAVMAAVAARDSRALMTRSEDLPPVIDFTWTPAGAVDLREMRGFLSIKDDYALDFTTYRMTLVEIDRTIDLPIEGLIGREYEQDVSFSLIADHPRLRETDRLTVHVAIADDKGQTSTITRVIRLKR
jgi:hypothetical protein